MVSPQQSLGCSYPRSMKQRRGMQRHRHSQGPWKVQRMISGRYMGCMQSLADNVPKSDLCSQSIGAGLNCLISQGSLQGINMGLLMSLDLFEPSANPWLVPCVCEGLLVKLGKALGVECILQILKSESVLQNLGIYQERQSGIVLCRRRTALTGDLGARTLSKVRCRHHGHGAKNE